MKTKLWIAPLAFFTLIACTDTDAAVGTAVKQTLAAQTPIIQTVESIAITEMPVTVEVTTEVEATRKVEVTREIEITQEVEVTREVEVEVTREVEVEVTRLVEQVVTATPTPTLEATATPAATNTPTPRPIVPTATPDVTSVLLDAMRATRSNIESFGGLIDTALGVGVISCQEVVNLYDATIAAPTFDVSGSPDPVRNAYSGFRASVDTFAAGAFDMAQNCREFLADPKGGTIPRQQWALARLRVNEALDILIPAITSME